MESKSLAKRNEPLLYIYIYIFFLFLKILFSKSWLAQRMRKALARELVGHAAAQAMTMTSYG